EAPVRRRVGAEPEEARLGVVREHAVPGSREEPRPREVGGVVARMESPGRHEDGDDAALVLLEGPLLDVALHLVAALVHRVRALAEAEVALAGPGGERDARMRDARRPDRSGPQRDDAGTV